uniref:Uncharacterized protein n=1 Tax=Trichogramma kaykai TaxID=54128 RepID=A0ABD2W5T7_9HYME
MENLQFEVIMKGAADGKTNIMCVNSIATQHGDSYSLPLELQPATLHKEFVKTTVYAKVKNVLKKRHQKRSVWVELTEELKKSYFDECGNIIFEDILLEEFVEALDETKNEESLADVVKQLMQKESATQNLRKVSEKFNVEKYSGKNVNVVQWLDFFEEECVRFGIVEDEKIIEMFRYFLDKNS